MKLLSIFSLICGIIGIVCMIIVLIGYAKGYYQTQENARRQSFTGKPKSNPESSRPAIRPKAKTCDICGRPISLLHNRGFRLKDGYMCLACAFRLTGYIEIHKRWVLKWLPTNFFKHTEVTVDFATQAIKLMDQVGDEHFWQQNNKTDGI